MSDRTRLFGLLVLIVLTMGTTQTVVGPRPLAATAASAAATFALGMGGGGTTSPPASPHATAGSRPGMRANPHGTPGAAATRGGSMTTAAGPSRSAVAGAPQPPGAPGSPVTRPDPISIIAGAIPSIAEMAFDNGQDGYLGSTSRYVYVLLNDYEYTRIAAIHAQNPSTKVIAYGESQTEGPNSCQYDSHPSWGVSYCYANQYHPEWFLLNKQGARARYTDNGYYMMDMGSPTYQVAWANNEIALARRDGFNGVFMDDVNLEPAHGTDGTLAKYTDTQYEQAVESFVQAVGPRLKAAGLTVIANIGNADPWSPAAVLESQRIAPFLSVYNHEFWMRWQQGSALFTGNMWLSSVQLEERVEATGTSWTGMTYGTTSEVGAMRYARASFLMGWNGQPGSALIYRPDPGAVDPYSPEWTADVGVPIDGRYAVGIGWRRDFSAGTVIVNPSPSGSQTFNLGATYVLPDGARVSSATLGPASALVLRAA